MPLVFAYGSNMDVAAMVGRCPRSRPLGAARLMGHRLAVMREGWLTAVRDPSRFVSGVLWDIAAGDMAALDRYEGVREGLYVKAVQPLVTPSGARHAIVYFGANAGPGIARPGYLQAVIAAARAWRLPTAALESLSARR